MLRHFMREVDLLKSPFKLMEANYLEETHHELE